LDHLSLTLALALALYTSWRPLPTLISPLRWHLLKPHWKTTLQYLRRLLASLVHATVALLLWLWQATASEECIIKKAWWPLMSLLLLLHLCSPFAHEHLMYLSLGHRALWALWSTAHHKLFRAQLLRTWLLQWRTGTLHQTHEEGRIRIGILSWMT
jgi:hypothetical protein